MKKSKRKSEKSLKGQSALEYLIIVASAVLVAAIVIGILGSMSGGQRGVIERAASGIFEPLEKGQRITLSPGEDESFDGLGIGDTITFYINGEEHTGTIIDILPNGDIVVEFTSTPQRVTFNIQGTTAVELDLDGDGEKDIGARMTGFDSEKLLVNLRITNIKQRTDAQEAEGGVTPGQPELFAEPAVAIIVYPQQELIVGSELSDEYPECDTYFSLETGSAVVFNTSFITEANDLGILIDESPSGDLAFDETDTFVLSNEFEAVTVAGGTFNDCYDATNLSNPWLIATDTSAAWGDRVVSTLINPDGLGEALIFPSY